MVKNNKTNSKNQVKKKTNLTNSAFQSKFLPVIQAAETEIKKLISYYALHLKSKIVLRNKIQGIIQGVAKLLPFSLYDRKKYIEGLYITSEKMIKEFYDKVVNSYYLAFSFFIARGLGKKVDTPVKMYKVLETGYLPTGRKVPYDLWSEAKGVPYVKDYGKLVKERIKIMAETPTISAEVAKKGISLWQKAELDIRHENQLARIQELTDSGIQYAWTSSHPDCSKRCEKWQGKLFDLTSPKSELSGFRMRKKVDGHTVYCFQEVIAQKDKYGYTNNIIVGFNCRHRLIPYQPGSVAPKDYDAKDIAKERKINAQLRAMERTIRLYKQKAILYNGIDQKRAEYYEQAAKDLTIKYKKFAEDNGFAWYQYRINI